MWEIRIEHKGLNKFRVIRGSDRDVANQKAEVQIRAWDEMWSKKQAAESKKRNKEEKLQYAKNKNSELKKNFLDLENILQHTLSINDAVDWNEIKDKTKFDVPLPQIPECEVIPNEPKKFLPRFKPLFKFTDYLIPPLKKKKILEMEELLNEEHEAWQKKKKIIDEKKEHIDKIYKEKCKQWEEERDKYYKKQKHVNDAIDAFEMRYKEKDPNSIFEYCDLVLNNSDYPDYFPKEFDIDYNPENSLLIVDYSLPALENIPTIKEIKYIQTSDTFKESHLSQTALNKLYDSILYQIALRTIHELYEADVVDAIQSTVFNGWVNSIDKGTGNEVNACIITVQTNKEEFQKINLANVYPKLCFKNLKGVGSSKLHSLTPVAPLLKINKDDRRFVSSHDVTGEIDDSTNIAAMDWEEFEHLVREIFQKEFSGDGGEVKVTQASRDGGVDAIAFDPDTIRGGKIVIQAKRYTNTVGVSAVRDLYGTVMNEGAMKGILITTSDYGPDAYSFAKDKPLTLLSGSNLLHLLEKHGTKAKIDLKEAKSILSEK